MDDVTHESGALAPLQNEAAGKCPDRNPPARPSEAPISGPSARPAQQQDLPPDARFICSFNVFITLGNVRHAAYLSHTDTTDELWVGSTGELLDAENEDPSPPTAPPDRARLTRVGRMYSLPRQPDEKAACLALLDLLLRAWHGFMWPNGFLFAGIVDESSFTRLVAGLKHEFDANYRAALENESEIIRVARGLKLDPRPSGKNKVCWLANCPGTNHFLIIDAAANSFGCGWCPRKGGVDDLKAFANERHLQRRGRASN